jgi:filamentous hemagglutinin
LENTWAKAVADGKKVDVTIKPVYDGTSKRPSEFKVEYSIDGIFNREEFLNTPTGGN